MPADASRGTHLSLSVITMDDPSLRVVSTEELTQETYAAQDYRSAIGLYWTMDLFVLLVAT